MRYELTENEWAAVGLVLPTSRAAQRAWTTGVDSIASFGSLIQTTFVARFHQLMNETAVKKVPGMALILANVR